MGMNTSHLRFLTVLWIVLSVPFPTKPTLVTVPLIVEGNAPIIELEFPMQSGKLRKARFLVDTGGGALLLGNKLMADVGAKADGPPIEDEGSPIQPLIPMQVELCGMALDLTGVSVAGLPASEWAGPRNEAEGIIPASLLRHYDVVFDYPGHKFSLGKPGSIEFQGAKIPAPVSPDTGFPRIETTIADSKFGFLLDTGGSFTMISRTVMDQWLKQNPDWPNEVGAVGFANMYGGAKENEAIMVRMPEMKIGAVTVNQPAAVSRPAGTFEQWMSKMMTGPIIGSLAGNVLRDFCVSIDYKNGFVYLFPSKPSSDTDLSSVGLILKKDSKGSLIVTGLSSNASPDVRKGIHAGDKLIAVDDVDVSVKLLAGAAALLQGRAGSQKRLTVERAGRKQVITVTVTLLLSTDSHAADRFQSLLVVGVRLKASCVVTTTFGLPQAKRHSLQRNL
jgi:hypothetical protein